MIGPEPLQTICNPITSTESANTLLKILRPFKFEYFWQTILIFLTAFLTNFIAHILLKKRKKQNKLSRTIANIQKYGYLLGQITYDRYECEIFSNYYDIYYQLFPSTDIYEENKRQIKLMPVMANRMWICYSKIFKQFNMIKQLIPEKKLNKINELMEKITKYTTLKFKHPKELNIKTIEQLEIYKIETIKKVN